MMNSEEKKMKNKKETIVSKMEYLGFYLSNMFLFFKNNKYIIEVNTLFTFIILFLSTLQIFLLLNNILDFRLHICFVLAILAFAYPKAAKQEKIRTENEINKFGSILTRIKPDNSNLFVTIFIMLDVIVLVISIIVDSFFRFPLQLFNNIEEEKNTNSYAQLFANLGDYVSGIIGTVIAVCAFGATLFLIYQQQKQINTTENSLKQQHLDSNFFTLSKRLNEYQNNSNMYQFYIIENHFSRNLSKL